MSEQAFRSNVLKALGLALLTAAGAARAAQIPVSPTVTAVPEAPPVEVKDGAILLSVNEAVEIALRRNLGLIVERYTRNQAETAIEEALGIYDPLLNGEASTTGTGGRRGTSSRTDVLDFGVDQVLPSGGTFSVDWTNTRKSTSQPPSESFNPFYDSGLNFTFNQPLLRNFGRFSNERDILVAQNTTLQSRSEFERQVVTTTQQVIDAYWNLVGAREQLVVAQESLALAKDLHERNRIQVEVGTLPPLELVQSQAAIATNEENIIRAQSAVGDAEDVLRQLLNFPQGPLWQAEIRPTTDPVVERVPVNLDEAIQAALSARPEIRAQELAVAQAEINSRFFRNQTKPSLDLRLSYQSSGVGGDLITRDPSTGQIVDVNQGGFGDTFSQITGLDVTTWSARLLFSYPLFNRTAKAQSASADIALDRARVILDQLRQQTITEVRQAARRVDTAAKSIDAAKVSREFQLKNLEAEKKRYENGMSTSFQITRVQQDVTQARSNEVAAIINYRTALAEYYRVIGRLLSTEGVTIDDPERPINRRIFGLWR
jgi:outer membrane protein TolC